jgi:HAD superfamily hydrolase (TIGR01549 family)
MSRSDATILPRAILFDMDGTLTEPLLDFPRIKAEMGIGNRPILEALAEMDAPARQIAEAVLHRHEDEAAACSTLNIGCMDLLDKVASLGMYAALITRNSRSSVQTVLKRHAISIEVLVTREDAPPKPSPEPLWLACRRLEIDPASAWMVGDGQYDIEAALAANIAGVWVSHGCFPGIQ